MSSEKLCIKQEGCRNMLEMIEINKNKFRASVTF